MCKHLNFDDRLEIQQALFKNFNIRKISAILSKEPSSIAREIKRHRYLKVHPLSTETLDKHSCPKLNKSPFVCNGCCNFRNCKKNKILYYAKKAQLEYETLLSNARIGSHFDSELLNNISNEINERLAKKQPIIHIFNSMNDKIPFSLRTFYNFVDKNILNIKPIKLPRKVKFPKKKSKKNTSKTYSSKVGRTYEDYIEFIANNPNIHTTQMDLVEGAKGTGYIMTLYLVEFQFLLGFKIDNKFATTIVDVINSIHSNLGFSNFKALFPILLTDNGGEFYDYYAIEDAQKGFNRTKVFYCHPFASCEKGAIENKHSLLRVVLPKGTDFSFLTQDILDKIISNINSCVLSKGKSGFEMFTEYFGLNIAKKLNVTYIPENKVTLNLADFLN